MSALYLAATSLDLIGKRGLNEDDNCVGVHPYWSPMAVLSASIQAKSALVKREGDVLKSLKRSGCRDGLDHASSNAAVTACTWAEQALPMASLTLMSESKPPLRP